MKIWEKSSPAENFSVNLLYRYGTDTKEHCKNKVHANIYEESETTCHSSIPNLETKWKTVVKTSNIRRFQGSNKSISAKQHLAVYPHPK